jgi:hypothetical protein
MFWSCYKRYIWLKTNSFFLSEFLMPAEEMASDSSFRSILLALVSVALLHEVSTIVSQAERK